jgi:nucleotide-binding universal stress UspA family protein
MKTIIACTDFSESSLNACKYAAMLAQNLDCKLILFNLNDTPLLHTNLGLIGVKVTPKNEEKKKSTQTLITSLNKLFPDLKILSFESKGKFKDEINDFVNHHKVQFAVLGLEAKERINKYIYGTHSLDLVGKIDCPVIIVPSLYKVHKLSRIVLSVDSNEKLNAKHLKGFEKFLNRTGAEVSVVHVRSEDEIFHPQTLHVKLKEEKIPVTFVQAKTIEDGIKKFYNKDKDDLIAILSKKHSTFFNLFAESHTKKIVFATQVPVLSIHD